MVGRLRWPSWFLPDHARPLPTLFTLTQRPSNDLTRLPNALSTTALHSRPLPIVLNSSKQPGTVGDTSTKFTDLPGPSKTHPRSFPTFLRLHKTSPDHQGRERSAVRSAKCDRGFTPCVLNACSMSLGYWISNINNESQVLHIFSVKVITHCLNSLF